MDSFGRLCLVFISLSFVGIVCPEIEVRDWCVQNTSVTCNAACSEALPSLPNFPGSYFACLEPTTTERTTTTESETTGVTTDVTVTDFTATDVTGTDVTATDVTGTDVTATDVTGTEITVTEVTPTEFTTTETTVTGVTRTFPTSSSATGICCNTHTTEPPEATTGPGPGSGTTAITGGTSSKMLRSATIGTGAVSALLYIIVVLCLVYVLVKNAVRHNKVHPDTQNRNDEGQESKTENGQPSSETEQPVPSSFQKMLQGSLTIGVLQVQVRLILAGSMAVIFILIIIGVVLAVTANHIASLVIFAICIVISLAFFVLLVAVKMMYDKPKKHHDEEDVCLENCPEKTFPFPNEGLKPINEDRPIENEHPIENERPSSASSSKAGRVVTTPHGENPKENSDDRNRKISSGSQAGDTTLLVTVDTDTMYRKPRKKKKKRARQPSIELGELRLPGARSSYGHIYNEHTT